MAKGGFVSKERGTLRIRKALSNNAAVVADEHGGEKVVTGKGVSYGRSVGDPVDETKVEKVFHLSSDSLNNKFQEILTTLPLEEIRIVEKIIRAVKSSLGRPLSDSVYISLADHIHFSLSNWEQGITIPNGLQLDVMRFYPDEFKLGRHALDIIEEGVGVRLPEDEAGFIALHIVNAEMGNSESAKRAVQATKVIEAVLSIVKGFFGVNIAEDSLAHYRFITHLRLFSQRLLEGSTFRGTDVDRDLLRSVSRKYPNAYRCTLAIRDRVLECYGTDIGWEELLYLTIHIQHAINTEQ